MQFNCNEDGEWINDEQSLPATFVPDCIRKKNELFTVIQWVETKGRVGI